MTAARVGGAAHCPKLDLDDGIDPGTIEAFNNQYRYVNATRDGEGDPVLRFDFELLHTAHQGHVLSQIDTWESLLDEFVRVTGWRD
ncbi:hypothetical protein ACFFGH_02665 [Lysobacter korlensis]|uniref:Uncharacterized protein n=1 Tax=Lysobacter korlensis TaxID=553636 RepID=A0ABV6RJ16_9GAMM